jgi:uncharacterized protein (DUF488 family)
MMLYLGNILIQLLLILINMTLYTVGHSNRSLNEFLDLLKSFEITVLVDVRSFPNSKKVPHFNRANLEQQL